ncbi:MAG: alpha/beta hydrolase [Actinomycetales bacterium]|nr:alpha/beta hydrolase [Actinomycetales bacterium]
MVRVPPGRGPVAFVRAQRRAVRAVAPELRSPWLVLPAFAPRRVGRGLVLRVARRVLARSTDPLPGVDATRRTVAGTAGGPPVDVVVHDPPRRERPSCALLWVHGGGIAAALAQRAHDAGRPPAFQLLVYPVLDDRTVLRGAPGPDDVRGRIGWTASTNRFGWTAYLGHPPRIEAPAPYTAPARRERLAGLPPAWIGVGDLDLHHDESTEYAERLRAAGVPCAPHVEPGMLHAADVGSRTPSMVAFRERAVAAVRDAVGRAPAVPAG